MMQTKNKKYNVLFGVSIAALLSFIIPVLLIIPTLATIKTPILESLNTFILVVGFSWALLLYIVPFIFIMAVLLTATYHGIKGSRNIDRKALIIAAIFGSIGFVACLVDVFICLLFKDMRYPASAVYTIIRAILFLVLFILAAKHAHELKNSGFKKTQVNYAQLAQTTPVVV